MEVQETIPGTTRIGSDTAAYEAVKKALHPEIREGFRSEMVRNMDSEDRDVFVQKANNAYDHGFVESKRGLMCSGKAVIFLLWFVHQSLDIDPDCGYCKFLDGIYEHLDTFFSYPHQLHGREVTTT